MIELSEEELHRIYQGITLIESELDKINKILTQKSVRQAVKKFKDT